MFDDVLTYAALWASCLLLCLGLTLKLVAPFSEILTSQSRVVLLRVTCYAGLFFLLCMQQWIYALILTGFMFDLYGNSYSSWADEPIGESLGSASGWLLLCGFLGLLDILRWSPTILRPLTHVLVHPVTSVGLLLGVLGMVSLHGVTNFKRTQPR
jgi:hypothetical protein